MALKITVSGLSPALKAEVENAVAKNHPIPQVTVKEDGVDVEQPKYTKAEWVVEVLKKVLKNNVKEVRVKAQATAERSIRDKVDADFGG